MSETAFPAFNQTGKKGVRGQAEQLRERREKLLAPGALTPAAEGPAVDLDRSDLKLLAELEAAATEPWDAAAQRAKLAALKAEQLRYRKRRMREGLTAWVPPEASAEEVAAVRLTAADFDLSRRA